MSTTRIPRVAAPARWQHAAATTAIVLAAVSVGIATATTADAKPKNPGPGLTEFLNCFQAHADAINPDNTKISHEALLVIAENCCTDLGGTYNEGRDACYLPNGDVGRTQQASPTPPPPGATAVLPPGVNTRTGIQ